MRILDSIEATGFFYMPSDEERILPGILRISPDGEITLEITQLASIWDIADEAPALGAPPLGISSKEAHHVIDLISGIAKINGYSKYVALQNCHYTHWNIQVSGGVSTSTLRAQYAFIGAPYRTAEEISFSEIRFSIEGIDEWVGISGISVDHAFGRDNRKPEFAINYTPPQPIDFRLPNDMDMELSVQSTVPFGTNETSAKISQEWYVSLKSQCERRLDDFLGVVFKIRNFLCFAMNQNTTLTYVLGGSSKQVDVYPANLHRKDEKIIERPIDIYFRHSLISPARSAISRRRMFFSYTMIKNDMENIINRWLEEYDRHTPAFNLYFHAVFGGDTNLTNRFLSLVRGIESLHRGESLYRGTFDGKRLPQDEFDALLKLIVDHAPREYKSMVRDKLKYANEVGLSRRIKDIARNFTDIFGGSREVEKFVRSVAATRNYLTHYDESLESEASKDGDLLALCGKIEVLFQLYFLKLIGMDNSKIRHIAENSESIRLKMKMYLG